MAVFLRIALKSKDSGDLAVLIEIKCYLSILIAAGAYYSFV